ncbi:MAG: RNase H family protein [Candidatus Helarchaeota archaeon]
MDLESLIKLSEDILKRRNINLKNPKSIRRFLDAFFVLQYLSPKNETLNTAKKKLLKNLDLFNQNLDLFNHPKKYPSLNIFHSILMIYQKAHDLNIKEWKLSAENILDILKKLYIFNNNYRYLRFNYRYLSLEEILFNDHITRIDINNSISLELLYYTYFYRIKQNYSIKDYESLIKLLIKNYYIEYQKQFAFYPTKKSSQIKSVSKSRTDTIEKDYWACQIFKICDFESHRKYIENITNNNNFINGMIERAKYYLDINKEDDSLIINLKTYYTLNILPIMEPSHKFEYKKIIMDIDFELNSHLPIKAIKILKLPFENIEWENIQVETNNNEIIKKYIDFFKEIGLFPNYFIDMINNFYEKNRNTEKIIITSDFLESIHDFFLQHNKNLKYLKDLIHYALICSENNVVLVPIEFFENKSQNICRKLLQLIFLKLFLDNSLKFRRLFQYLILDEFKENIVILKDNKGYKYLVKEEEIERFLDNYQRFKKPKYFNIIIHNFLKSLKDINNKIDFPRIKSISDYLVYSNILAKIDETKKTIKGLRFTIEIRDLNLKEQLQKFKDVFNLFFRKICNIAEKKYYIREFREESDGPKKMINFLKNLYKDGYHHIIKLDIKSCTDSILFSPLKYILKNTLPNDFWECIFNIATKYTIEFEDRRISPERGIAQGNPISNELYIYIILILIMGTLEEIGLKTNELIFLCYGDDILILSKDLKHLEKIFPRLRDNFLKMGWEFNINKTILFTTDNEIPDGLKRLKRGNSFSTMGFEVKINKKVNIYLKSERIFRIKYKFYYNLILLIQKMINQENYSMGKFLEALESFERNLEEFSISKSFNIYKFLSNEIQNIIKILKSSYKIQKISKSDDLDKLLQKIFRSCSIFPKIEVFEPDIEVWTDGAAEPNPGDAGIGVYIPKLKIKEKRYIGYKTNNQAEFEALIWALEILEEKKCLGKKIQINSDSKIMVDYLNGLNYIKKEKLRELGKKIKSFEKKIKKQNGIIKYKHIYGADNEIADTLSREAIEEHK